MTFEEKVEFTKKLRADRESAEREAVRKVLGRMEDWANKTIYMYREIDKYGAIMSKGYYYHLSMFGHDWKSPHVDLRAPHGYFRRLIYRDEKANRGDERYIEVRDGVNMLHEHTEKFISMNELEDLLVKLCAN